MKLRYTRRKQTRPGNTRYAQDGNPAGEFTDRLRVAPSIPTIRNWQTFCRCAANAVATTWVTVNKLNTVKYILMRKK